MQLMETITDFGATQLHINSQLQMVKIYEPWSQWRHCYITDYSHTPK